MYDLYLNDTNVNPINKSHVDCIRNSSYITFIKSTHSSITKTEYTISFDITDYDSGWDNISGFNPDTTSYGDIQSIPNENLIEYDTRLYLTFIDEYSGYDTTFNIINNIITITFTESIQNINMYIGVGIYKKKDENDNDILSPNKNL